MTKKRITTDALKIIDHLFFDGKPEQLAALEEARADAQVARTIYALRMKARLSQRELASLVGTSTSIISRLEDADYEGYSLAMLRRIAKGREIVGWMFDFFH